MTLTTNAGTITPTSATFTGAEGGVLTVNYVEVTQAGTNKHIMATFGSDIGTSNDFTVNVGNFLIEKVGGGDIGPQTVGTEFSVQITARDQFNNVVTTFTRMVDLTTNAGTITPASVTFVAGDNGVHVESVTVTQAGTDKTITATYGSDTGTSNPFTVNGGALDHLVLSPAMAKITAGGSQAYTAQGFDQYNNSLGDVTGATSFSISPNGSCTGATCTATVAGAHTVSGNDSDKMATASLQVNAVAFTFAGFFAPVDNPSMVNAANAGQAIPVKWQLTLNGVPVSDPSSFLNLTSYSVTCGTFVGNPSDIIEEYAAGSSGLQYLGSGNWQFNWKTPKNYANTCRVMVLTLSDNSTHIADFKFK